VASYRYALPVSDRQPSPATRGNAAPAQFQQARTARRRGRQKSRIAGRLARRTRRIAVDFNSAKPKLGNNPTTTRARGFIARGLLTEVSSHPTSMTAASTNRNSGQLDEPPTPSARGLDLLRAPISPRSDFSRFVTSHSGALCGSAPLRLCGSIPSLGPALSRRAQRGAQLEPPSVQALAPLRAPVNPRSDVLRSSRALLASWRFNSPALITLRIYQPPHNASGWCADVTNHWNV
jgi:hypothetical protein